MSNRANRRIYKLSDYYICLDYLQYYIYHEDYITVQFKDKKQAFEGKNTWGQLSEHSEKHFVCNLFENYIKNNSPFPPARRAFCGGTYALLSADGTAPEQ